MPNVKPSHQAGDSTFATAVSSQRRGFAPRANCLLLLTLICTLAPAQQAAFNRELIVLDPAHGGTELGAQLTPNLAEKDLTLAFASRLRSLLTARGFTVVLTRTADLTLTADQRAELANRARSVACIILHATASGTGVHLATSTLAPVAAGQPNAPVLWDSAQAIYLPESRRLAAAMGSAIARSHAAVVIDRAPLRPLDNLTCPALSLELAPASTTGSDPVSAADPAYQQRIAEAIAGALVLWRNQAQPPQSIVIRTRPATAPSPPSGARP